MAELDAYTDGYYDPYANKAVLPRNGLERDQHVTPKYSSISLVSSAPGKLLPLELCRFLAAVLVACLHAGASINKYYGFDIREVRNFGAGVDFFFVLSGFVMTYAHWYDIGRSDRVKRYCVKRFLRIYPPYWIITAIIVMFYLFDPSYGDESRRDFAKLFCSIFLLPYTAQPVVGQAWTLVYEMFFYGLFSLVIIFGRRAFFGFVLWAICILLWQAAHVNDYLSDPLFAFPVSFYLSPFNIEFIFGVAIGLLVRRGWRHLSRTLALGWDFAVRPGIELCGLPDRRRPRSAIGVRNGRSNCDPWLGLSTMAGFRRTGRDYGHFRRSLLPALPGSPNG